MLGRTSKPSNMNNPKNAFTLIEALISVALTAIGFAGVYALVGTSSLVISNSLDREKLRFQNSEIMETISSDLTNAMVYNGVDLSNCNAINLPAGNDTQAERLINWCNKMEGEVGTKRSSDTRIIRVERRAVGSNFVNIVSLELNAKTDRKSVYLKRVFYASP